MKVIKKVSEHGLNIFIQEDHKYIEFSFGGNGDLYLIIRSENEGDERSFIITKENYEIYDLFLKLFYDIENINIYDEEDYIPPYIEDEDERQEYLDEYNKKIEEEKRKYRLYNYSNYNELFDKENDTITWYSDETAHEVANILNIKKEKESFRLTFTLQPYIEGYDEDFYSAYYIPIRFRNSGSSYDPFNIVFMRMYNNMKKINDVNDIGHQIHMEEYIYNQNKMKKLMK